jgi:hypothetical protein
VTEECWGVVTPLVHLLNLCFIAVRCSFNIQKFGELPTMHSVFAWISEQTAIVSLYRINWLVFITEAESVYYMGRNGSLNQTDTVSSLKG